MLFLHLTMIPILNLQKYSHNFKFKLLIFSYHLKMDKEVKTKQHSNNQLSVFVLLNLSSVFHWPLQLIIYNFLDCLTKRTQLSRIFLYPNIFSTKQLCVCVLFYFVLFYLPILPYLLEIVFPRGRKLLFFKCKMFRGRTHSI